MDVKQVLGSLSPLMGCAIALSVLAAVLPPAAWADSGYEAQFLAKSPDLTLESGEVATSWFHVKNIGTKTWRTNPNVAPPVRLGTSRPRDRASAFGSPDFWVLPDRATHVDPSPIAPGEEGTFEFRVRAPAVDNPRVIAEHFEPVADAIAGDIGGWMGSSAGPPYWPLNGIPITYRVVPPLDPAVRIDEQPGSAELGSTIRVAATGTDNLRINRLEFSLAGQEPVAVAAPADLSTFTGAAELDTSGVSAGTHPIEATAVDGSGRTAMATTEITLTEPPPVANGANATRNAALTAAFGRKRLRSRTTVSYGRSSMIRGRLTGESGAPISAATLRVATRVLSGRRDFRELSIGLVTDAEGRFRYKVPPGASRQILLSYTAFSNDTEPAATRTLRLSTRAGLRFRARPLRVRGGQRVYLTGRLRGGHIPAAGVLVTFQGRVSGHRWRTFMTARTRRGGRFAARYRFVRLGSPITTYIRSVVSRQTGYPYTTGRSGQRRVRVVP